MAFDSRALQFGLALSAAGLSLMQPGNYEISASAKGFATLVRKGITLNVGRELVLNLTTTGCVSEQVTVTAEASTVNLANATGGKRSLPPAPHA